MRTSTATVNFRTYSESQRDLAVRTTLLEALLAVWLFAARLASDSAVLLVLSG